MNVDLLASPSANIAPDVKFSGTGRIVIADFVEIHDGVHLDTGRGGSITIGPRSKLKSGVILRAYGGALEIGRRTSIGEYSIIASHGGVAIGSNCMFGPYVFINAAEHIISGQDCYRFQGERAVGIVIEDGVWLGARVSVLDGVLIGARAVVGAHSLVVRDIAARALAVGTPTRTVRAI